MVKETTTTAETAWSLRSQMFPIGVCSCTVGRDAGCCQRDRSVGPEHAAKGHEHVCGEQCSGVGALQGRYWLSSLLLESHNQPHAKLMQICHGAEQEPHVYSHCSLRGGFHPKLPTTARPTFIMNPI